MKYKREVDLCRDVITWLANDGWSVFQEVIVPDAKGPVDIVAIRDQRVRIVEAKLVFSFELLAQAVQHVDYANEVCVATPWIKSDYETNALRCSVLKHLKLNRVVVDGHCRCDFDCYNPDANTRYFLDAIKPEHRINGVAGSKAGTAWTPWKMEVAMPVAEFVRDNPGCSLKEICTIPTVKNYYRNKGSASAALHQWLRKGVIKHVRTESDHGKTRYFPMISESEPRI